MTMPAIYSLNASVPVNANSIICNLSVSTGKPTADNNSLDFASVNFYVIFLDSFLIFTPISASFTAIYILIKSPAIDDNGILMSYYCAKRTINKRRRI